MKMRLALLTAITCVALGGTSTAFAQRKTLKVGDAAPSTNLSGVTVVKQFGDPADIDGKPMVVEFWATWCGPCKQSIPHLTKLQKKYGADRLNIIGVTNPDKDQDDAKIERFVKKQGSRMNYWVVSDEGEMGRDWMKAADQDGIPCAFIVGKQGKIQFIGHPMDRKFEDILGKVVRGRYDHVSMQKAKNYLSEIERARKMNNWDQYYTLSDKVIEIDPLVFYYLHMDRFDVELMDRDNSDKAYQNAIAMSVNRQDDPELLSWMAEHIALSPSIPDDKRNLDVALALVKSARNAGGTKDTAMMVSEAKIRMARGEVDQAVKLQRKASWSAPESRKDEYERLYQEYKSEAAQVQE
jgi:thiol-disulfide isomerase/thioredoxin